MRTTGSGGRQPMRPRRGAGPPETEATVVRAGEHVVQFYAREEALAEAVATFLGAGLAAGEAALVITTPEHLQAFERELAANGIDLAAVREAGQYVSYDAAELLAELVVDGHPDPARVEQVLRPLLVRLKAGGRPLRVYGDMVGLLVDAGEVDEALTLEALWNDLAEKTAFSLFCGYSAASVGGHRHDISDRHSTEVPEPQPRVLPDDTVARRFEPVASSARVARRFVVQALQSWGYDELVEPVELVVGEMVGNAIRHGGGRFQVSATLLPEGVRVAVTDSSPALPEPRPLLVEHATNGRGLHLIAALARRWGTELHDSGKTVWAELDPATAG